MLAAVVAGAAGCGAGSPAAAGGPGAGRLVVRGTGDAPVPLGSPGGAPTVIGREEGCAVRFPQDEKAVSRRHAEVSVDAHGRVVMVPLGVNGVKVNGQSIRRGSPHVLRHGDVLAVQFSGGVRHIVFEAASIKDDASPTLVMQAQRSPLGVASNSGVGTTAPALVGKSPAGRRSSLGRAGKENAGGARAPPPPPPPPPLAAALHIKKKAALTAVPAVAPGPAAKAPAQTRRPGLELSVNLLQDTLKGLKKAEPLPVRNSPAGKALKKAREAQPPDYHLELNNAIQKRMLAIKMQRAGGEEATPTKASAPGSPAGTPKSVSKRSSKKRTALKGATPRSGRKHKSVKFQEGLSDSPLGPAIEGVPVSPQGAELPHVNDTASLSQWAFASMVPAAGSEEAATPEFKKPVVPPVVATPYGFPVAATPLAMRAPAPTPSAGGRATGGKAVALEAIEKLADIARFGLGLMRRERAGKDDEDEPHIFATPSLKHRFVEELQRNNDFSPAGVAAAVVAAATPEPAVQDDDTEPLPHIMATPSSRHPYVQELQKAIEFNPVAVAERVIPFSPAVAATAAVAAAATPEPAAQDSGDNDTEPPPHIMATPSSRHPYVQELQKAIEFNPVAVAAAVAAVATPKGTVQGDDAEPLPHIMATPSWQHAFVKELEKANITMTPVGVAGVVKDLEKFSSSMSPQPHVFATPSWKHPWVTALGAGPSTAAPTLPPAAAGVEARVEVDAEADARKARWQERKRLKAKAFVRRAKGFEAMSGHYRRKVQEASRVAHKQENTNRALNKRVKMLEAMLLEKDYELNELMQRQLGNPVRVQAADACAGTTPLPSAKKTVAAVTPVTRCLSVSRKVLKSAEKMRSQAVKSGRVVVIKQVKSSAKEEPCNVVVVCRPKQAEARCPTPSAVAEVPQESTLAQLSPVPMKLRAEDVEVALVDEGAEANIQAEAKVEPDNPPQGEEALSVPSHPEAEAAIQVEREDESEAEEEDDVCYVCGSSSEGSVLLLCDGCDKACHLKCTKPRLRRVPKGDWFCTECKAEKKAAEEATKQAAGPSQPKQATRGKRAVPEPEANPAPSRRSTRSRK